MKSHLSMRLRTILLVLAAYLVAIPLRAQTDAKKADPVRDAQENETCRKNLKTIYDAIQAYRKDNKDLPNWLVDLVPKHLPDNSVLTCPVIQRTGGSHPFKQFSDPKIPNSYAYQFSAALGRDGADGAPLKLRDWRRQQMALVGGGVPILSCVFLHPDGDAHVSFDGQIFDTKGEWENRFADVVDPKELSTITLAVAKRLSQDNSGSGAPEQRRPPTRPRPGEPSPLLGKPAPDFKLDLLEGGQMELAAHKDKSVVILDFWATWCGPCRVSMPFFAALAAEYKDKGVVYYGVNQLEPPEKIQAFLKATGTKMTVSLDKNGAMSQRYGAVGIPTIVFIGKDGTVQSLDIGLPPNFQAVFKAKLDAILAGKNLTAEPAGD